MQLTAAEQRLCKAVRAGQCFVSKAHIRARVIRHLVLSLAVDGKQSQKLTAAGISIYGATIDGRILLDKMVLPDGAPVAPIELRKCVLIGGFSGAHGHFSRLSLRGCTFSDSTEAGAPPHMEPQSRAAGSLPPVRTTARPVPTIDLSGATVDGDLDLQNLCRAPSAGYLWVRAPGTLIDGHLDVSGSHLRAPKDPRGRSFSEPPIDALDLAGAEIRGEFNLVGHSTIAGRLSLRGATIRGDAWMSGATIKNRGQALLLQAARIDGFLMMEGRPDDARGKGRPRKFRCTGEINLEAAAIGCSLHFKNAVLRGKFEAPDLSVRNDVVLDVAAEISGPINLCACRIGGSLDISGLALKSSEKPLNLKNGSVGHALRLVSEKGSCAPIEGEVDLRNLSCTLLDDAGGRLWGRNAHLRINHFIYQQATWLPETDSKRKHRRGRLRAGIYRAVARMSWLSSWPSIKQYGTGPLYWKPWEVRRNWLYQQFKPALRLPIASNYKIAELEYHPQPFEQVIRVARAEGREDFAIEFEILRDRIEWRHFNRRTRWSLGPVGIGVAAAWLVVQGGSLLATLLALIVTWILMAQVSSTRDAVDRALGWAPPPVRAALTEALFYVPALALFVIDRWYVRPFQFVVAFQIYLAIRFFGVFAHAVVRNFFGYLRRPPQAIATLIGAFLVGWFGVYIANGRHMLVVAADPVAPLVGMQVARPHDIGTLLMGSESTVGDERFIRDVSCFHEISEPLYALDVLIPIVDLGEEARCEIRRVAGQERDVPRPDEMPGSAILRAFPDLPLGDHRFWWWAKALYAIAGWLIVTLSILTFAQANKTRVEPPTEHK